MVEIILTCEKCGEFVKFPVSPLDSWDAGGVEIDNTGQYSSLKVRMGAIDLPEGWRHMSLIRCAHCSLMFIAEKRRIAEEKRAAQRVVAVARVKPHVADKAWLIEEMRDIVATGLFNGCDSRDRLEAISTALSEVGT